MRWFIRGRLSEITLLTCDTAIVSLFLHSCPRKKCGVPNAAKILSSMSDSPASNTACASCFHSPRKCRGRHVRPNENVPSFMQHQSSVRANWYAYLMSPCWLDPAGFLFVLTSRLGGYGLLPITSLRTASSATDIGSLCCQRTSHSHSHSPHARRHARTHAV